MNCDLGGGVEQRPSDSPYVERVYRVGPVAVVPARMRSVANSNWELVVWRDRGETQVAVRGPETGPTVLDLGPGGDGETIGIIFRHGAFLAPMPVPKLVDTAVSSPHTTARSFVLQGQEWETPGYDNAEVFVDRLVRAGLLVRDPLVTDVLRGDVTTLVTPRSVQRRVAAATGLTQGAIRQIERARRAVLLLGQGVAAIEVAQLAGYHDQPHLARSLTRFTGCTASQLRRAGGDEMLSLLYKTEVVVRP